MEHEIKSGEWEMTDEEKAEEYWHLNHNVIQLYDNDEKNTVVVAYKDGLAEGRKEIEQLQQAYTITVDKSVIREQELETQIEKMKCCENCKWYKDNDCIGDIVCTDNDWNGWELAE